MLIIFGGLPGTGKTTIAKQLAKRIKAVYLRVDSVEQPLIAINKSYNPEYNLIGPEGYEILYAIAKENLSLGLDVIADTVNSIQITRSAWQDVALSTNTPYLEVELICSDIDVHKNRIITRNSDIPGHQPPSWQEVIDREYEPWHSKSLEIDTSKHSIEASVQMILDKIEPYERSS